jgi:hypothetical protein
MTRVKKKGTHKGSIFSGKPAKSTGRTGSSSNRAGRRARRAEKSRDIEDVVMATVGDKLKGNQIPQKADRPKKREVRNEQNAQMEIVSVVIERRPLQDVLKTSQARTTRKQ